MMQFNFLNIANRYIKLKLGDKKDCSITLAVLFEVYDKFLFIIIVDDNFIVTFFLQIVILYTI